MAVGLSIRAANASDLPATNTLMHDSHAYRGEYYKIIENYFVTPEMLAKNKVLLVEQNETLLGFYSLVVDGIAYLDLMFVSDDAQGLGVGRALFDHMKATDTMRSKSAHIRRRLDFMNAWAPCVAVCRRRLTA
jgi:GNAT superfamily N-acetyltransferase